MSVIFSLVTIVCVLIRLQKISATYQVPLSLEDYLSHWGVTFKSQSKLKEWLLIRPVPDCSSVCATRRL